MTTPAKDPSDVDRDHPATPYDPLLRAGFCLVCGAPIQIDDQGRWTHAPGVPESPLVN